MALRGEPHQKPRDILLSAPIGIPRAHFMGRKGCRSDFRCKVIASSSLRHSHGDTSHIT